MTLKTLCGVQVRNMTVGAVRRKIIRGVVFDMDGTLTVPCIDFADMKRRVGVPPDADILHEIERWNPDKRLLAFQVLAEIEREANAKLKVMPGALEICTFLDDNRIPRGLITRNVKNSVDYFHSKFFTLPFSPALSREFKPFKPDPGPLLHICETWKFSPSEVMMVGDSAKDDIVCGNRAGAFTCLLDENDALSLENLPEEQRPTHKVKTLVELLTLLQNNYELVGTKAGTS